MAARFDDSWVLVAYLVLTARARGPRGHRPRDVPPAEPDRVPADGRDAGAARRSVSSPTATLGAYGRGLLAGVIAFVVFFVLHLVSPRSMGFGDVKLSFVLGLSLGCLGWGEVVLGLFLGFLYGAVIGIVLIVTRLRADRTRRCPSARSSPPARSPRSWWATPILDWYRGS